jgi:23S rRNA (pseudouridine1915-N3)-methyltransferase
MQVHLIAVGNKMPPWVTQGYAEYAKRLPPECQLRLVEIPPGRRSKNRDPSRAILDEGERLLAALPRSALVLALDIRGNAWNTEQLAQRLQGWLGDGRDVALLVGGPDGLSPDCLARAEQRWSLGPLTLPHPLVRVLVAEQLYRAWSILRRHPYHRA